jgi:hypothetical protein
MERATTNLMDHPRQKYLWGIQWMIQIGHKIKKIVILVLVGDPFKPEVIRASANLFENVRSFIIYNQHILPFYFVIC